MGTQTDSMESHPHTGQPGHQNGYYGSHDLEAEYDQEDEAEYYQGDEAEYYQDDEAEYYQDDEAEYYQDDAAEYYQDDKEEYYQDGEQQSDTTGGVNTFAASLQGFNTYAEKV